MKLKIVGKKEQFNQIIPHTEARIGDMVRESKEGFPPGIHNIIRLGEKHFSQRGITVELHMKARNTFVIPYDWFIKGKSGWKYEVIRNYKEDENKI